MEKELMTILQWIVSGAGIAFVLFLIGMARTGLQAFNQVATGLKLTEQAMSAFKEEVKADIADLKTEISRESSRRLDQFDNLNLGTFQKDLGRVEGRMDTIEKMVMKA